MLWVDKIMSAFRGESYSSVQLGVEKLHGFWRLISSLSAKYLVAWIGELRDEKLEENLAK